MTCIATINISAHDEADCETEHIYCHCGTEFCGEPPADELAHDCETE